MPAILTLSSTILATTTQIFVLPTSRLTRNVPLSVISPLPLLYDGAVVETGVDALDEEAPFFRVFEDGHSPFQALRQFLLSQYDLDPVVEAEEGEVALPVERFGKIVLSHDALPIPRAHLPEDAPRLLFFLRVDDKERAGRFLPEAPVRQTLLIEHMYLTPGFYPECRGGPLLH